ncbi:DUF92 domain-containing protein [Haloferacaceae archaeon DSL9]
MTKRLRRTGAFAAIAVLSLAAPALGPATAVPFAAIALLAAFVIRDGPVFELFARPGDHRDRRLYGLAAFTLAIAGLALLATMNGVSMPPGAFAAAVFVVAFGALGEQAVRERTTQPFLVVTGFVVAGFVAALAAQTAVAAQLGSAVSPTQFVSLAIVGALTGALLRELLYARDEPIVLLAVGLVLWFFAQLLGPVGAVELVAALVVTVALGYISYALGTASVAGMLTGVLLGLLTIILGGFGWFAILIAFFGIGGLSSKFRYEDKASRGVAEENDGARGTGNVLGNSSVALAAVLGYAASEFIPLPEVIFLAAFAGSLATALSDTLSSEIGGLYDSPRLITSFERVPPGTDGGVTWQGELAGLIGACFVGLLSAVVLPFGSPVLGGLVVALGGIVGMTVDSLLGATVEGGSLGNQSVNFLATLSGALASVLLALIVL